MRLKDLDDSGAVTPLMAAAHYNDKNVRTEAIDSLEKFGSTCYHIEQNSDIENSNGKIPQIRPNNNTKMRKGKKHLKQLYLTNFFKEKD